jgi:hypothetical protein
MNFNNLNSERIMKTETITDHDLSKIVEDWYKGIEHVDTGLKTAFAAGYRVAERQANGHATGERQLTIHDVSGLLPAKKYDIDFAGNVLAGIEISDNTPKIFGAINGYGDGIDIDKITITERQ